MLQLQIPCFSEFSSEFFDHEGRKPRILPKTRKIKRCVRERSSDSREFHANRMSRFGLPAVLRRPRQNDQGNNREFQTSLCSDILKNSIS